MIQSAEPNVRALSAATSDDRDVSQSPVDTAGIRRVAALTYGVAEAYIALGQRIFDESAGSGRPPTRARLPTSVVRELDQVSEHLLALATHLARLAIVIEQAGPPRTPARGKLADRRDGS
jgi:hypothetical protein